MKSLAKLDCYEYFILPGVVQILLDSTKDPIMVDILSEIERANGRVYVEGKYFLMMGYNVHTTGGKTYLDLTVSGVE